jgi:hypothetical protein
MDGILSIIGSCSIVILITYIIKKGNEYLYYRNISFKFDKDDEL